jgi:hypothetical protein
MNVDDIVRQQLEGATCVKRWFVEPPCASYDGSFVQRIYLIIDDATPVDDALIRLVRHVEHPLITDDKPWPLVYVRTETEQREIEEGYI